MLTLLKGLGTRTKASFDKRLLFDEKSIREEEDTVKEKNRGEGKRTEGVFC